MSLSSEVTVTFNSADESLTQQALMNLYRLGIFVVKGG